MLCAIQDLLGHQGVASLPHEWCIAVPMGALLDEVSFATPCTRARAPARPPTRTPPKNKATSRLDEQPAAKCLSCLAALADVRACVRARVRARAREQPPRHVSGACLT